MSNLIQLKDAESNTVEYFDMASLRVYADEQGSKFLREVEPTDYVLCGERKPLLVHGQPVHHTQLEATAMAAYYGQTAGLLGRPVDYRFADESGRVQKITCGDRGPMRLSSDKDGRLVAMDLGIGDVHTPATTMYAGGYHIADGVADAASPVIPTTKQSDVYYTWNATSDFNRKLNAGGAPGAQVAEVNPGLAPATFTAQQYALGGFMPTEVQANADAPLQPFTKMVQIIVDGLRLEREYRVMTLLQTSVNWNSNLVNTLAAGSQWNGGAAADPIANIHKAMEQSYMSDQLCLFWSELVQHDFVRSPAVQKYIQMKAAVGGIPTMDEVRQQFGLPPIYTASMKYLSGGVPTYVWGNHVVLCRIPKQMPPVNQMEIATSATFRWTGGTAPDGSMTGGFLVRTYWDPKRGARGGTMCVAVHNDAELMTSGLVGGLILNAHQ